MLFKQMNEKIVVLQKRIIVQISFCNKLLSKIKCSLKLNNDKERLSCIVAYHIIRI